MNANKVEMMASDEQSAQRWVLGVLVSRVLVAAVLVGIIVAATPAAVAISDIYASRAETPQAVTEFDYYPARFTNQASEVAPHIEAF